MNGDVIVGIGSLYEIIADVEDLTEQEIRNMAIEIHTELMDSPPIGTPVDTGWARSNWQMESGSAPEGVVGSKANVSDDKALADRERIKRYRLSEGDIFIQNNVPYIGILNQKGHSSQTPEFFVDRAVLRASEKIRGGGI